MPTGEKVEIRQNQLKRKRFGQKNVKKEEKNEIFDLRMEENWKITGSADHWAAGYIPTAKK